MAAKMKRSPKIPPSIRDPNVSQHTKRAKPSARQQAAPAGGKSQRADLAIGKNNENMILFVFQRDFAPSAYLTQEKHQTRDGNSIRQNE